MITLHVDISGFCKSSGIVSFIFYLLLTRSNYFIVCFVGDLIVVFSGMAIFTSRVELVLLFHNQYFYQFW